MTVISAAPFAPSTTTFALSSLVFVELALHPGEGAGVLDYVLPMVSALGVAGVCVALTAWMFRRETVIFGR